jgi:hypothetical protein
MQIQTIFDMANKPFDWSALVPPAGLLLFGVSLIWTEKKRIGTFGIKKIGYVLCCAGVLVACPPTRTKQKTYSLSLTNSNTMLY